MKLADLLFKIILIGVAVLCVFLVIFIGKNYRYILGSPSVQKPLLTFSDQETGVSFSYSPNLTVTKIPSYKPHQISPPVDANPTIISTFKAINISLQKQTIPPSFEIRYNKEAVAHDSALQTVRIILLPLSSEAANSYKDNKSFLPKTSNQNSMLLSESEWTTYHIIPIFYHEKNSARSDTEDGYLITRGDKNSVLFIYYSLPSDLVKQDIITIIESSQ